MNLKRATASIALVATVGLTATACFEDDADIASENVSKAADNFEVNRRIVFFNGITDTYLLEIKGACSIEAEPKQLEVICKVGKNKYVKEFLGLSNNVSYFVEQGEPVEASAYHYRKTFKPQSILPDVDFRGSTDDGPREQG